MTSLHMRRRTREQLSAWIPVLLMALLALGTWWLLSHAPQLAGNTAKAPPSHDPDYEMRDFTVRNFDATGRFTSQVTGVEGWHYPDTDLLEIRDPRMRSIDANGIPTVGRADRAISNPDGTDVKLYDQVRIVRDAVTAPNPHPGPQMEYLGNYLNAFPKEERYTSDQPVELVRGSDHFTGDVFDYDGRTGIANLRGNVHGVIQPASTTALSSKPKR